jgi:hypothetical protein
MQTRPATAIAQATSVELRVSHGISKRIVLRHNVPAFWTSWMSWMS